MIENPFSLKNKTILVTGASSGIGKEIAISLGKFGANVVLNGRNELRLQAVKSIINKESTVIISGDIRNTDTIQKIINSRDFFDGIVHAAGVMKLIPFKFITLDALNEIMNVNFISPTNLSLELFKKKKISQNGSIVYITSINGSVVGSKANSMYAASKGALSGMVKAMSIDLAKNKIRVNEIAPGMVETQGTIEIKSIVSEDAIKDDIKKYPLGRYGKPSDVANACIYLLSDASNWVTGTKIVVDGGFSIQ